MITRSSEAHSCDRGYRELHPVHDGVPYGRATLDDHPAHNSYVVTGSVVGNADVLLSTSSSAD
jgi:hypothetical protein